MRKPERDQRIVVRPDRAVVIGHRIVAHLAARDGADAPAREEVRSHQIGGDETRAILADHAAEQHLPGIRGAHLASPLLAVERKRVGSELLAPERLLETLGERPGLRLEPLRDVRLAEPQRASRGELFCGVDVALDLGERDVALRELAVGMEDRVERVLPALVGEPLFGGALVFDKAVLIGVAGTVDPGEPGLDRRPQLDQRFLVAGALDIAPREQDEQGGRIHAAVILRERHLAQRRHLAAAHLVQDLSRRSVGERIDRLGLEMREPPQHALGDPRIDPQHLQRGDQPVAAERRRVPGNAGIGIASLRRLRHQHVEVGHRLAQHLVEDVVGGLDAGRAVRRLPHLAAMREQAPEKARRLLRDRPVAGHGHEQRFRLMRIQLELPGRGIDREPRRTRIEMQARGPLGVVEAAIFKQHVGRPEQLAGAGSAVRTPLAAHLEQIGKIIVEQQRQLEAGALVAVVLQPDALIGRAAPQEDRAHDVQQVLLQHNAALAIDVGVGQVDRQSRIVVAQVRAEQAAAGDRRARAPAAPDSACHG